jgi:hypothetical protein
MTTRGAAQQVAEADHVFQIVIRGDDIAITTLKSVDGILYDGEDMVLDPIRDGVRKFIAGEIE